MKDRLPISPDERAPLLHARREAKMTSSAHAYVRGSTRRFYEWLAGKHARTLPRAPRIWIGGDCHVGNLGPVADKDGEITIQLRDLDQAVIGSPAHDLLRLGLSLAMAVRASALPGAVTARVIESLARGYEVVLETYAARGDLVLGRPPPGVSRLLARARKRSNRELLAERLGKGGNSLPMGKRFWPLLPEEREAVEALLASSPVRKLVTSLASRADDAPVKLVDAAYWVKGCSSLGLWRAAVLVRVGSRKSASLALLDIKEAQPPLAPRSRNPGMPAHHGERVVAGARALSPALGQRMAPARVLGREVFVRELLPQDLKLELDTLDEEEALAMAYYLAGVVAEAHARQVEPAVAGTWLASFRERPAQHLTAPAWLWDAVVALIALHEGAYLEHCREHALPPSPGVPVARPAPVTGGVRPRRSPRRRAAARRRA